jgi:hypothetical protein
MPSSAGSAPVASAAKCSHEAIVHGNGNGKHSARHPCFLAINTPLGNLKMWMNTTFRGFKTGHHAMRYRAESSTSSIDASTLASSCRRCFSRARSSVRRLNSRSHCDVG